MTPAQIAESLQAVADQLSLRDIHGLLSALIEPTRDLDVCGGNYVARAESAIRDRLHARVALVPTP